MKNQSRLNVPIFFPIMIIYIVTNHSSLIFLTVKYLDFERWLKGFADQIAQMSDYQQLRVSRITTPAKMCGGNKCLLIYAKRCPVVYGKLMIFFIFCNIWCYLIGNTITDFKKIVTGLGGQTNASQVVLSSSSTDTKLITKGPNKNTEGKRCYMIPITGLSKVIKTRCQSK